MAAMQITLLVFLSVFFLLRATAGYLSRDREQIAMRVQALARDSRPIEEKDEGEERRSKFLTGFFRVLTPKKLLCSAEKVLSQADIPLRAEELAFIQLVIVVCPALIAAFILQSVPLAAVSALVGAVLPTMYINNVKARRLKLFNEQLADGLTIMSNSLRAGYSFLQTLDSLQKETVPPLSTEFGRALQEMRLGTTTEQALKNLAQRVKSDDFDLIVTAVIIQRQVGGNLAEILDNIALTIRERVRIKGEVRTLTSQGRISGIIVSVLPLFLAAIISVTNPSYITYLFRHPLGLAMVGGAFLSELVGIMFIKKIVNIEY